MPTRIEREKQTVAQMIKIYCNGKHHSKQLCAECQELLNYAQLRLERCKFGNQKHTCKNAPFIATSPVCDKRCARSCATRALACYGTTPLPPYGIC